jgi:serine/threonine protein kinase
MRATMTTTQQSYDALINEIRVAVSGGPANFDELFPRDQWRALLQELPAELRYFTDRFAKSPIDDLYKWWLKPRHRPGFVGLLLLTLLGLRESERRRADPAAFGETDADRERIGRCRTLVEDAAVQDAIGQVYGLDRESLRLETLTFHQQGTTSLILTVERGRGEEMAALKLLLAPFLNIQSIADATRDYARQYRLPSSSSRHIVRSFGSGDGWILMEFVAGETLATTLAARRFGDDPVLDFAELKRWGKSLFEALVELQDITHSVHGDLTPSNIIVDGSHFVLIDLGRNYLYTRSITGMDGAESVYVAPEVREGKSSIDRADLYSLGQLLILIAGSRPTSDGVVPDVFYEKAPLIARYLEDLIDRSPRNRLLTAETPDVVDYRDLCDTFLDDLDIASAAATDGDGRTASKVWPLLREVVGPYRGEPSRQRKLWKAIKDRPGDSRRARIGKQYFWSYFSAIVSTTTIVFVIWWLARDAEWDWGNRPVEMFNRYVLNKPVGDAGDDFPILDSLRVGGYDIPDWDHNWQARLIGLSYALLGAKIYQSLFARLAPWSAAFGTSGKLRFRAWAAEASIRTFAVVNSLLVLSCTFVEAKFWPIAAALGQTYAVIFNWSCVYFAKAAFEQARTDRISTVPDDDGKVSGLSKYAEWVPSSFFYMLTVWVIGILIYQGGLKDGWLYAWAVASVNIGLFYVIKCGLGGPYIRVALQRAVMATERVSLVHTSRTRAPVPAQPSPSPVASR